MGEKLRVRGRGLDAGLRGELRLTSPGGRLAVNGTLRTVDGTYQAYGQKLVIDRGVLTFAGPVENPRLDIEATRPNLDVRVGVAVTGTALNPRIRLFSEPEHVGPRQAELAGRSAARARRPDGADTALLQQAALALLSGEGPGRDRPADASRSASTRSRCGRAPGRRARTRSSPSASRSRSAGTSATSAASTRTAGTWQLIYRVAQRITVRAQAGADNAIDVIWTWRWK